MQNASKQFGIYPSLEGRVVLVTGGATGIGASIVEHFARQGSRVAFMDVQDEAAHYLVAGLTAQGCTPPIYLQCDLRDVTVVQRAIKSLIKMLGTVDVLINNAANDQRHSIESVTPESFDQSIAVNLRPQFFTIQAVLPAMRKAGRGSIINMSSIAWMIPNLNMPIYNTAKAAIVGLTRAFAHECGASNIRVNAVLPGAIATERQRRLWYTPEYLENIRSRQALPHQIEPEEVARLILFLAADDSSAITNQSYVVDAGFV